MRVLEHGLRALALRVSLTIPAELQNWHNIIDQIEKEIRTLQQAPRTAERDAELKFCSESAAQFRYFKDAWRNHVSHAKEAYDSFQAESIMSHVRDFMQVGL